MTRAQKLFETGQKAAQKYPESHVAISVETLKPVAHGKNFGKVFAEATKKVPSGNIYMCKKISPHATPIILL